MASINYALASGGTPTAPLDVNGPLPSPTQDIFDAAQVIKAAVGATRVVLLGTSAGANLAALAHSFYPTEFDGFVGFYGAYDLNQAADFDAGVQAAIVTFTGGSATKVNTASPALLTFPAQDYLMYHGDADVTIDDAQSTLMDTAHAGTLSILAGEVHAFKVFGEPEAQAAWVPDLIDYIING